ncbi:MAG: bifunctional [glutamine synthetase] adenylyltransferase/[glutamine synthetase]-adenylyl-L-tyrosine phosphorylase [Pseudomonadota bacterium]
MSNPVINGINQPIALDQKAAQIAYYEFVNRLSDQPDELLNHSQLLGTCFSLSPFLKNCARHEAELLAQCLVGGFEAPYLRLLEDTKKLGFQIESEADFMAALRKAKRRAALVCGLADLARLWDGETVTKALSDFASACLSATLDFILLQQSKAGKLSLADQESPQVNSGLVVLGMGKFGANELNYSSDIDLVVFHDASAAMQLETDDPHTLLNRIGKQLIRLMQERTSDGYVFRTDLRLRPDPSSTPLIIPIEAALNYYEGQGQNWERAAMIKARPVAGDIIAGERFLRELAPFIWRKYLDFAAINDVHSIKRQIHAHKGHGEIRVKGHNIKLGRGGIREIEFFVQTQQLIAGGRNPSLRVNGTIAALYQLHREGWIERAPADELADAYRFLRDMEHRLQMVQDEQTHTIPESNKEFKVIAALCGYSDNKNFSNIVTQNLKLVERHYAGLFEESRSLSSNSGNLVFTGHDDDPDTVKTLESMGYKRPGDIIRIVKNWHVAKIPALQASQARELLTELVPDLLSAFAKSASPDHVVFTFDQFISGLPAGIQLFAILKANPALNDLLHRILVAAPRLSTQIARKPHIFDAMLEPYLEDQIPTASDLEKLLRDTLDGISAYELKLDAARRFFSELRFQAACRFFGGTLSTRNYAAILSHLAEAIIAVLLDVVISEFESHHGRVPGAQVCILGMGKLGSAELTADSDLDLIFLYDFDQESISSDGKKPLDPTVYFIRLMQRFIAAMSAPTAEGIILELDFRLRPSGNAGPLATPVESFLKYQSNDAWVWESQALTRARTVAGDSLLRERVQTEIPKILKAVRGKSDIRAEIAKMRDLIEKEKGTQNTWDLKTAQGSLIDIEFISQWLVLKTADGNPLPEGTFDILVQVGEQHLQRSEVDLLIKAHGQFSNLLHLQRTCIGEANLDEEFPEGFTPILSSALDMPDLDSAQAHIQTMKKSVHAVFNRIFKDKKFGSGQLPQKET